MKSSTLITLSAICGFSRLTQAFAISLFVSRHEFLLLMTFFFSEIHIIFLSSTIFILVFHLSDDLLLGRTVTLRSTKRDRRCVPILRQDLFDPIAEMPPWPTFLPPKSFRSPALRDGACVVPSRGKVPFWNPETRGY